jgi:hypothetical protein
MTKQMEANHLHDKKASEQKHAVGAVLPVAAQGVMSARSNTKKTKREQTNKNKSNNKSPIDSAKCAYLDKNLRHLLQ